MLSRNLIQEPRCDIVSGHDLWEWDQPGQLNPADLSSENLIWMIETSGMYVFFRKTFVNLYKFKISFNLEIILQHKVKY